MPLGGCKISRVRGLRNEFCAGERADASMHNTFERMISQIEDSAVDGYELLLAGGYPGDRQSRAAFAHFVGLMYACARIICRMVADLAEVLFVALHGFVKRGFMASNCVEMDLHEAAIHP
ncbi:MAG: hypothetical protein JWM63_5306 [Gammaproteobacteria bacterium]|jgi:hypothetical protein|nr:hypothetical protein [Gammaproteobacteria bacterium]